MTHKGISDFALKKFHFLLRSRFSQRKFLLQLISQRFEFCQSSTTRSGVQNFLSLKDNQKYLFFLRLLEVKISRKKREIHDTLRRTTPDSYKTVLAFASATLTED